MSKHKQVHTQLPSPLKTKLNKIAKDNNWSLNTTINIILQNFISDHEEEMQKHSKDYCLHVGGDAIHLDRFEDEDIDQTIVGFKKESK